MTLVLKPPTHQKPSADWSDNGNVWLNSSGPDGPRYLCKHCGHGGLGYGLSFVMHSDDCPTTADARGTTQADAVRTARDLMRRTDWSTVPPHVVCAMAAMLEVETCARGGK